jgi:hypothetical protein
MLTEWKEFTFVMAELKQQYLAFVEQGWSNLKLISTNLP